MKNNDGKEIWIARIFTLNERFKINPVCLSLSLVFVPALILVLPFIIERWHLIIKFTPRMWSGIICGLIWISLSPLLINSYVQKINETFLEAEKSKILTVEYRNIINSANNQLRSFGVLNAVWMLSILTIAVWDQTYLSRFGLGGFSDPCLYVFLLVLAYVLYYTSIGIRGVLIVYRLITDLVSSKTIILDFYNSDRMGGLRCLKELIFTAAKLFATGALFFPILLDYIIHTDSIIGKLALYLSILIFTMLLIMTFLIPIKKLYNYANKIRDNHLDYLGEKLKCLATGLNENKKSCSINDGVLLINYYQQVTIVSQISMFNVKSDTYLEVFGSILIPVFTFFINAQDIINIFQILTS